MTRHIPRRSGVGARQAIAPARGKAEHRRRVLTVKGVMRYTRHAPRPRLAPHPLSIAAAEERARVAPLQAAVGDKTEEAA